MFQVTVFIVLLYDCIAYHSSFSQVFLVTVGLSDLPLTEKAAGAMGKLKSYAILLADTVVVTSEGPSVVTEKLQKEKQQVRPSLSQI